MSKYVDLIAWSDCAHLRPPNITQEELDEFERGLLPHQREARRTGRPSLGAGAIYQVEEKDLLIEPIPIPDWWEQAYGFDPGWRVTAAIFGAHDPEHDVYYLTGEYYGQRDEPVLHAEAVKRMMPYPLIGAMDPAGDQSNQLDGRKLRLEYEDKGLELVRANNAVHAGIHHVLTLMQTGRLKVFNTLSSWLREFRLYRRDEKGRIVKENDHLQDATRYLLMTEGVWRAKPAPAVEYSAQGEW